MVVKPPKLVISTPTVVPRMPMVPTGVSTSIPPLGATLPVMNTKVPWIREIPMLLAVLLGL